MTTILTDATLVSKRESGAGGHAHVNISEGEAFCVAGVSLFLAEEGGKAMHSTTLISARARGADGGPETEESADLSGEGREHKERHDDGWTADRMAGLVLSVRHLTYGYPDVTAARDASSPPASLNDFVHAQSAVSATGALHQASQISMGDDKDSSFGAGAAHLQDAFPAMQEASSHAALSHAKRGVSFVAPMASAGTCDQESHENGQGDSSLGAESASDASACKTASQVAESSGAPSMLAAKSSSTLQSQGAFPARVAGAAETGGERRSAASKGEKMRTALQAPTSLLRDLSFDLGLRERVALVGASGVGKSTLLHLLGLLDQPQSGEILVRDHTLWINAQHLLDDQRTALRASVFGFVYQFHHLLPEFTALENVMIPQMIVGVPTADARRRAKALLDAVGLADRMDHKPGQLSGGQQQRTAIARALANQPAILLADEPTGNLDEQTANDIFELFLRMGREHNLALVMATHNTAMLHHFDRVLTLQGGALQPWAPSHR